MSLEDRLRQSFAAALDEARGKLDAELQSTLASVHDEHARERDAAVAAARQAAEAELSRAFDEQKAALQAGHESALQELRAAGEAMLAAARQDADTLLVAARAEAERGQLEQSRLQQQADAHAAAFRETEQARAHAVDALVAGGRRMLEGVKALDGATSLSEVLDALTAASAAASGRAAMMVVKGDRLLGWRTTGFGELDAQPRTIESSTADADALARAVATGKPVVTGSGPASNAPAFVPADGGRAGIAVPLLVGGRAVAVVYADSPDATIEVLPSQAAVEVLVRHAGRCLEALTVQRAAQARTSTVRVSTPA